MRAFLIGMAFAALVACQPAPAAAPEAEAAGADVEVEAPVEAEPLAAAFVHASATGSASLAIQEQPEAETFGLECKAVGPSLTLTGATSQVALGNMVFPYSIVLSGASFEAELVPAEETALTFAVTTPLTPEVLSALSVATTARIFVNDGYAFVESGIDPAAEFERFAAACADLTGIKPAP